MMCKSEWLDIRSSFVESYMLQCAVGFSGVCSMLVQYLYSTRMKNGD